MVRLDLDELAVKAEEFVRHLLKACDLKLQADGALEGKTIRIDIRGEDADVVLEDSARFLYAVSHLVNQIFFRQAKEDCDFLVDCNNYRQDRADELRLLAQKAAEHVRLSGSKVVLQPMPSSERRIIHLALAGETGVRTESEGSGRFRRVQIVPA